MTSSKGMVPKTKSTAAKVKRRFSFASIADFAVAGADSVFPFVGTGIKAICGILSKNHQESTNERVETLIEKIFSDSLTQEEKQKIATAELDAGEVSALFAAVANDIESEKTELYALAYRAIALGQVQHEEFKDLLLALREARLKDLRLLNSLVTSKTVVPAAKVAIQHYPLQVQRCINLGLLDRDKGTKPPIPSGFGQSVCAVLGSALGRFNLEDFIPK